MAAKSFITLAPGYEPVSILVEDPESLLHLLLEVVLVLDKQKSLKYFSFNLTQGLKTRVHIHNTLFYS